jgi:NAD(P)-dependent dehydrogenase (short-subunit alcohol dehydrogenase family)
MRLRRNDSVRWESGQIPDLHGRTAVVTGANTGVGFEVARALADRGAAVVLACRDLDKARAAAHRIATDVTDAAVDVLPLDLASLRSVRAAASDLVAHHAHVDLLVNNAGVMWTPPGRTEDGFELQLGTNHLGHFAFTGLVLDLLLAAPAARIVTVASPAHREGAIDVDDLGLGPDYSPRAAYARSKLANLLFTHELHRRLTALGGRTIALAAHPGSARTELNRHLPALFRGPSWGLARPITHPAEKGALSILRAAADPAAKGGEYYGPDGRFEFRGWPIRLEPGALTRDVELQRRLWDASERLTGVRFAALTPS